MSSNNIVKNCIAAVSFLGMFFGTGFLLKSYYEANTETIQGPIVRVEGPTQGTGFLLNHTNNGYEVLTAKHVVDDVKPGEEVSVFTDDKRMHAATLIKKSPIYDLALLEITTNKSYATTPISAEYSWETRSCKPLLPIAGDEIEVIGFPHATTAIPSRIKRYSRGNLMTNIDQNMIAGGYNLLYSNSTFPGMSGSPIFKIDKSGNLNLIGMHGRGEVDSSLSLELGVAVKTGSNQGIPLNYIADFTKIRVYNIDLPCDYLDSTY